MNDNIIQDEASQDNAIEKRQDNQTQHNIKRSKTRK